MSEEKENKKRVIGEYYNQNWWKYGLYWGAFMYVIMVFGFPYYEDKEITIYNALIGVPIWMIAGLGYGYLMKKYYQWATKKK